MSGVARPDRVLFCRARLDGYRTAMEAARLPVDPAVVVRADPTREAGHSAAVELLRRPDSSSRRP